MTYLDDFGLSFEEESQAPAPTQAPATRPALDPATAPAPPRDTDAEDPAKWAAYFDVIYERARIIGKVEETRTHCRLELTSAYMMSDVVSRSTQRAQAASAGFEASRFERRADPELPTPPDTPDGDPRDNPDAYEEEARDAMMPEHRWPNRRAEDEADEEERIIVSKEDEFASR